MDNKEYIVGTVREIQGTSVIVRMFEGADQFTYFINGKRYSGVLIGSYIGIKRGQYLIVGLIEKESAIDNLNDIENHTFSKKRFVREFYLKIIGSFHRGIYTQGMVAFPQIFNDVVLLSDEQIHAVIAGGQVVKKESLEYLKLGKIWPNGIDYYVHWPNLFNTHIAIFGNTGSGKSNTLTKLYTSLFDLAKEKKIDFGESKFCFLDFNGEYTSEEVLSKEKDVIKLSTRKTADPIQDENKFSVPYNVFWDKDLLSTIFGATEQTQQPFLSRLINFYFKDDTFIDHISNYVARAFQEIYASSANLDSLNLWKSMCEDLNTDHNYFSEWIDKSIVNNTLQSYYSKSEIEGWNGVYWNNNVESLNKERDNVEKQIKDYLSSIKGRIFLNPISQLKIAAKLQMIHDLSNHTIQYDHLAPLLHRIEARSKDLNKVIIIEPKEHKITDNGKNIQIISLKDVNKDIRLLIPLLVAKVTYSHQKSSNSNHKKIFNLIIDEAHNILSDRSSVESEKWKDYRLDVFEEIIKEGRKFGYYLTIASQRPADISATIVSQIHNYFIHRLVNDNDLKMLQNTLSALDAVTRSTIPNLSPGQAIVTGVSFEQPVVVQVDELDDSKKPKSSNTNLLKIWRMHEQGVK
ncbi:ATP-binding protein [Lactobacillus johnsonii]|uniref:ATP-binding protein n=1 Tax=Lactobacillus johnsonii TaxID=33959 RepID=UPI00254B4ED0|nr:ATP-binding protein [Lactobacillus johnsonii]